MLLINLSTSDSSVDDGGALEGIGELPESIKISSLSRVPQEFSTGIDVYLEKLEKIMKQ